MMILDQLGSKGRQLSYPLSQRVQFQVSLPREASFMEKRSNFGKDGPHFLTNTKASGLEALEVVNQVHSSGLVHLDRSWREARDLSQQFIDI